MNEHIFEDLDDVERALRTHVDEIGYVALHQRAASPGERHGDASRGRLNWSVNHLVDVGLHDADDTSPPDYVSATIEWLRRRCAAETLVGSNRFRVRAYLPGGVRAVVDETVACTFDGDRPVMDADDVEDMVRSEAGLAVRETLRLVQESVMAVHLTHRMATSQWRELVEERAAVSRDLMAQNRELSRTVATLKTADLNAKERVLVARERAIAAQERETGDLAQQADAIGRAERVLMTALGMRDLPDEVRELLPTMATPDMREFLADPDVAAMLKNPDARAALLPVLRGMAKSTVTEEPPADGDLAPTEP